MTRAQKFLQELKKQRTPVISPEVLERVREIAKDKKKATEFLKRGGFLDSRGQLAAKYRSAKSG